MVDDGSTDNFAKVMEEIILTPVYEALNIKVVRQENRGAAAARNRGLAESRGEYVIFWDADTVAKPKMLEKMLAALGANPSASYAYCQFKFGWTKMNSHNFDAEKLKRNNYIDTTSLIRRADYLECFSAKGGPAFGWDESLRRFQDWDLWLTMLEQNKTGVFVPEVLYKKITRGRQGYSHWFPKFFYKLLWKTRAVQEFEAAREIILKKHGLS